MKSEFQLAELMVEMLVVKWVDELDNCWAVMKALKLAGKKECWSVGQ